MSRLARQAPALVALAAALSGTAYAVVALPSGSVGTRQLRSKAVTPAKLARSVIPSSSVRGARGADGASGAVGPAGERGAPGADGIKGTTGEAGPSNAYTGAWAADPPAQTFEHELAVPSGSYVVRARARVTLVSGGHTVISCNVQGSSGPVGGTSADLDVGAAATLDVSAVAATTVQDLLLVCTVGSGHTLSVQGAAMGALRVATLNG